MLTTAELIAKQDKALKDAQDLHRSQTKKIHDNEMKRFFKMLKKTNYFNIKSTDEQLLEGLQNMVRLLSGESGMLVHQDTKRESESETSSTAETEPA